MPDNQDFQERFQRIERLVHELEAAPDPAIRASAQQLVRSLLELHGIGLERMLEIVRGGSDSGGIVSALTGDKLVGSLLLLHSLHPVSFDERVRKALEHVRSSFHLLGDEVELLSLVEGAIRIRVKGSGRGCGSSSASLRSAVEDAIYGAAPDLSALAIEEIGEPPAVGFVAIDTLRSRKAAPAAAPSA